METIGFIHINICAQRPLTLTPRPITMRMTFRLLV